MEKLNFDILKYQLLTENEKVNFFVKVIFNLASTNSKISSNILDEEIECLYFDILKIVHTKFSFNDSLLNDGDKSRISLIFKSLNFRQEHEYGFYTLKKKLGYTVFLEFKRLVKNNNDDSDNDFSDTENKEKLIILDKLGVIELLVNKLKDKDNATHLADIVSAITGIDNKKGTLTGYCNYLIRPANGNKNSPYYSEKTVSKSLKIFDEFNLKS